MARHNPVVTLYAVDEKGTPVQAERRPSTYKLIEPRFLFGYSVVSRDNENVLEADRYTAIEKFIALQESRIEEIEATLNRERVKLQTAKNALETLRSK